MNILNKLGIFTKKDLKNIAQRSWLAGQYSRFQDDWVLTREEINKEIKSNIKALRGRIYDLRQNNPVVSAASWDIRTSVVGPNGFDLQPMIKRIDGQEDNYANTIIKNEFDRWSSRLYASLNQRYSFLMLQYIIAEQLFVLDGEVIIRKYTTGEAVKDNKWKYTLQLLDPNHVDYDLNKVLPNGNLIVMGYEYDKYGRLKAVHFRFKNLYQQTMGVVNTEQIRIDANELIIAFDPITYNQIHGVPHASSVMMRIKDLDMWEFYSLQNAKHSAAKMGFITKNDKAISKYRGIDEEDERGKYMDIEGGTIEELGIGESFQAFDPKFPHEQHSSFVRSIGREIAAGWGRDYTSLFGDRENESYSSARSGELKDRAFTAYRQSIMREQILIPIYESWLQSALINSALEPLSYAYYERYKSHYWQGYVKPWVDFEKEVKANILAEENGYKSKTQIVSEMGNRYEDILRDKILEKRLEEKILGKADNKTNDNTNDILIPKNGKSKLQKV